MSEDKIGKIEKVDQLQSSSPAQKTELEVSDSWSKMSLEPEQSGSQVQEKSAFTSKDTESTKESVMDISSTRARSGEVTVEGLVEQTQKARGRIEEIKQVLESQPNDATIKKSVQHIMQNKLSHIDDNLRVALSKVGAEVDAGSAVQPKAGANPIERFLGFLTHGQGQLDKLRVELEAVQGKQLSSTDMLVLQNKIVNTQQEIELFVNCLNTGLSSLKALMNVQV